MGIIMPFLGMSVNYGRSETQAAAQQNSKFDRCVPPAIPSHPFKRLSPWDFDDAFGALSRARNHLYLVVDLRMESDAVKCLKEPQELYVA